MTKEQDTQQAETETVVITLGHELRAAREQNNQSLEDIAHILNIKETYIKAIEAHAFDNLPAPVYVIGFIRSYATLVNLDADALVAQFKACTHTQNINLSFLETDMEPEKSRTTIIIGGVLGLLCLILIMLVFSFNEDDDPFIEATSETSTTDAPPIAPIEKEVELPQASAPPPAVEQVKQPVKIFPPLSIQARARTWLRLDTPDGTVLFSSVIDAGEKYTLPDNATRYLITTNNAGALQYVAQDKIIGTPGRKGERLNKKLIDYNVIIDGHF